MRACQEILMFKPEIDKQGAALIEFRKYVKFQYLKRVRQAVVVKSEDATYMVMFKREYYQAFQNHFPNIIKDDGKPYGYAQIMSIELLYWALRNKITYLVFVTPDRKIYKCRPIIFKKFVEKHHTEVPHLLGELALPLDYFERVKSE